ncbi:MAG: ankyrin repeat domain-containing protein, partial [Candidatus Eremiobacteraeota bacterium]|nr:ankyrin repeat domain-containing protein [Candidatus Eremiobacteraeota bacterium]
KARFSDVVVELLRRGVSLPPLALHEAAAGGEPTIVALFLKLGADPNERDEFGRTPLHALARAGDDRPGAPCHFHREAIRLLTEAGAQPSLVDHTGKTPFEAATSHQEVRELLAEFEKDSGHDS